METNGVASFRHRSSPSSDRFLSLFSKSQPQNPNSDRTSVVGDELNEDDVFWTGNFSQSDLQSNTPSTVSDQNHKSTTVRRVDSSGILAALPGDDQNKSPGEHRLLVRKVSLPSASSSSRMIPAIPKHQISHERECFLSVPSGNIRHSAPVNVPKKREVVVSELSDTDKEMLPPHEIVARGANQSEITFSCLEGVGRTLKGRDLRQVRNAVWRQTGFLD